MSASNLARLKSAYAAWHESRGKSTAAWLDLFSDDVHVRSMGSEAKPLAFAQERQSKAEAVAYFAGIAESWTMIHWTPEAFFDEGDRIAVFAICAWTNKQTGKSVETPTAHLWQFRNGKAVSVTEIFDSARVLAAASP